MKDEGILNLKIMSDYFRKGLTIRGYLQELLLLVWEEGESFNGKRPFGNSGWEYDLYAPLIRAKVVKGELDEDGYIETIDEEAARKLITKLIKSIFNPL